MGEVWRIHLWAKGETDPAVDPKPYPSREEAHAELVRTLRWDTEHAASEAFPFAGRWVAGTVFAASAEAQCDSCGRPLPLADLAPCPCGCKSVDCRGGCGLQAIGQQALAHMRQGGRVAKR